MDSKTNMNQKNLDKSKNIKKYMQKNEAKSTNIEMFKMNKNINKINENNLNLIRDIALQQTQNRDKNKKAKKMFHNKNNELKKSVINNTKLFTNFNQDKNSYYVDNIEQLLKSKNQSINPNIKKNKNFLQASINEYDLFNFNNIIKENNDIFIAKKENGSLNNELKPYSDLQKKNKINNYIEEKEAIKNIDNNIILNKKNIQKNNEFIFNQNKDEKKNYSINLDKKQNIQSEEKELNKNISEKKIINVLVPMTNFTKENNCFLNTLIQVLSNLDEFRDYLLENVFKNAKNDAIKELCELINSYKIIQEKYKNIENPIIEPTLTVNSFRKYLNDIYGNYIKGECGDPMETLENLLNLIHKENIIENPSKQMLSKSLIDSLRQNDEICKCPSHNYFFLKLTEIKFCNECYKSENKFYDKNCYIFNIFAPEIVDKLNENNQQFNSYKLTIFKKIKKQTELYENKSKTRISKCKCKELNYAKKIRLLNPNNPYLILNLTWEEEFPNMIEILNIYSLIPMVDDYSNLFSINNKDNKKLYIKSIILYGIYHYVCIIYFNTQKRWGIIDDKTIKYIDKYYDLIDYLLRNHLMPVGLFYSQNKKDKIEEEEKKSNAITNDEYLKLFKFCEEVEKRRELKLSITKIKGSFNETNENYLNNNIFYNSVLNLLNSSTDSDYEEIKKKIEESKENKKEDENEEEKKDINIKNFYKKSNDGKKEINGSYFIGDFNESNLKGGLIELSNSNGEQEFYKSMEYKNIKSTKKEEKEVYLGKTFCRIENK